MLVTILSTIFVIGILVFFHELGHFMVAKWSGIKVEKFSLGFPPTLISKKWGQTVYAIGVVPLGGYVKMAGENPGEEAKGEPWEFMSKPVWKRFLVIFAGPFMNFVLAAVVLAGIYFFRGKETDAVFIDSVLEDAPAAQAGIQPGDEIVEIDGVKIRSFMQLVEIVSEKIEEPVVVGWKRNQSIMTDTLITYKGYNIMPSGDSIMVGKIGITAKFVYEKQGLFQAVGAGFSQAVFYCKKIVEFVIGLVSRKTDPKQIGGPLFIGKIAGDTARSGFDILMEFLALLSVNLAVLNVLPIPVLDGGHMIFLGIEKLKGSPVALKTRLIAQQIGIAFILILIIFVTFNDITR